MHFAKKLCYNGNMENFTSNSKIMGQRVSDVLPGTPAERFGIVRGDTLLCIDGEPVIDLVDYEYLTANACICLSLRNDEGTDRTVQVQKEDYEPLGLSFATSMMDNLRTCKNHCIFCFIDQMPQGVRTSLHVKDDDWRMSFIMGNYVTLTNVDDREIDRILARHVSPIYVSLHATDPGTRVRMMQNPSAGRVLEQLRRLKDAGIRFHLQVVLCPDINDGDVLRQTLVDVETLLPAAQSLAIVPVGLTKYREKLYPLRCYTGEEAAALIDWIAPYQKRFLEELGTRFVYLSDEWYGLAEQTLPPWDTYDGFPQIENGVGLLRLFESEFQEALSERKPLAIPIRYAVAGGITAERFMRPLMESLRPYQITICSIGLINRYFGKQITVGGLITGQDLIDGLLGKLHGETLLIPRVMLREGDRYFLDNMTLTQVEHTLGIPIKPFFDGEDFINIVFGSK